MIRNREDWIKVKRESLRRGCHERPYITGLGAGTPNPEPPKNIKFAEQKKARIRTKEDLLKALSGAYCVFVDVNERELCTKTFPGKHFKICADDIIRATGIHRAYIHTVGRIHHAYYMTAQNEVIVKATCSLFGGGGQLEMKWLDVEWGDEADDGGSLWFNFAGWQEDEKKREASE